VRHRFHALCPYFAMFPESFAEHWLARLTRPGDLVLDPFCGRGTAPFQALLMGRQSVGCDTNPVAYCISRAKTNAPPLSRLLTRIDELEHAFKKSPLSEHSAPLHAFFRHAYHRTTLLHLTFLRNTLRMRQTSTDCMISALALGSLHGETERSDRFLSNQMPHTISTKPEYSIRFWEQHGYKPPERDTFELLRRQAIYRYESGRPRGQSMILNLDMRELPRQKSLPGPIRCAITSPPYFDVTNYAEDQWLRLWFLGGPPYPAKQEFSRDDRHSALDKYWTLLADMWRALGLILAERANVVIRLGATRIDPERLVSGLEGVARAARRRIRLLGHEVSEISGRQTDAFRPGSKGCKLEVDCHFQMA